VRIFVVNSSNPLERNEKEKKNALSNFFFSRLKRKTEIYNYERSSRKTKRL